MSGLRKEDFTVFEDGEPQEVAYFSSERVPVSLGLVLDTSGSMTPDKMSAARSAIDRFVHDLLGADDELFFLEFANRPDLVQEWTTDSSRDQQRRRTCQTGWGHRDVRRGCRCVPMASIGKHPQEGDPRHLRRQRHEQPDRRLGSSGRSSARARCWCTRSVSTAPRC